MRIGAKRGAMGTAAFKYHGKYELYVFGYRLIEDATSRKKLLLSALASKMSSFGRLSGSSFPRSAMAELPRSGSVASAVARASADGIGRLSKRQLTCIQVLGNCARTAELDEKIRRLDCSNCFKSIEM